MAVSSISLCESTGLKDLWATYKFNLKERKNTNFFKPSGFTCFVGPQGSGKSLSAVNYVDNLMKLYPKCILVTNLILRDYPVDNIRIFKFESAEDFLKYKNGKDGVIFLVDEIHLYLGSMKGNNNINPEVLQEICQQRKQRVHIVATTQFYAQLNINLRRHFDCVILCKSSFFGYRQKNLLINRDSITINDSSAQSIEGEVVKKYSYFKNPNMYSKYDTYQIIENKILKLV